VNLDAIAKRVTHKESLPRCWATVICLNASSLQSRSQAIYVRTLKPKMPLGICAYSLLLNRNMNTKPAGIKPDTTANSQRLWLWNLSQPKMANVKLAGYILAAFWHRDVNVGKVHIYDDA
jgi:hypothetical protein